MFKKEKYNTQASRKTNNRWADDDDDNSKPPQRITGNNFSSQTNKTPSFIKKHNQSSNTTYNSNNQSSQNNIQKDTRFALEIKLIDDILQPTGIKVKPDEKSMVDFCRRAKNFDRQLIFNYITQKIAQLNSFVGNNEKTNCLIKCLYLISYLVDSKIPDLYDLFLKNKDMFTNIKSNFRQNKKICELIEQILHLLGDEGSQDNPSDDYQKFQSGEQIKITEEPPQNKNLLDLDNGEQNNNLNSSGNINLLEDIFMGDNNMNKNDNIQPNIQLPINQVNNNQNNQNNLLDGIFGNNTNYQKQNNDNIFPLDIFPPQTQNPSNNNLSVKTNPNNQNIEKEIFTNKNVEKKGFNFIKSKDKEKNLILIESSQPQKKGFSFIKPNNNKNQANEQIPKENNNNFLELNDIFSNVQNNNVSSNNNSDIKFDNVFNLQPNNNDKKEIPVLIPQQPSFNYEQVYENTEHLRHEKKVNDPFNFVNDMLKK